MTEKKIKKIKDMSENEEQSYICSWCLQNNLIPVSVPNGFNLNTFQKTCKAYGISENELKKQNAIQIKMLKKQGLHTGFPDIMIIGQKFGFGAILFLENKVKNNKPSPIQLVCHEWLRSLGYTVEISTSTKDAIEKIKNFKFDTVQTKNEKYREKRKEVKNEVHS